MEVKNLEQQLTALPAELGINEVLDLFNLLDTLLDAYDKAKADGVIDFADLQYITPVVLSTVEAFKGADKIIDEMKNVDTAEATVLFQRVFSLVQRLILALSTKTVAFPVVQPILTE